MRYSIFSNTTCPLLNIAEIGYCADAALTRFGPGVRNSYIVHYVISGKGSFNGRTVTAGQGFLITPGMQEQYRPDARDPWSFVWFLSDDAAMGALFELYKADEDGIFAYDHAYVLEELVAFLKEHRHALFSALEMAEIFLRVLKHQPGERQRHTPQSNAELYCVSAQKYMAANLHRSLTVAELTAFLGVSQPYLFQIFKEKYGKSPKQYMLEQKLARAKTLLCETDMTVVCIAHSVGFSDALSFSKCFRDKVGLSPQNYRNKTKNKG